MVKRGGRSLTAKQRALFILPIWVTSMIWMWTWWLQDSRVDYLPLFIPLTLAMLYEFLLLPGIFLYFLFRGKSPGRRIAPKNQKVAIISPCLPSKESLDIIEAQMIAMKEVTYPHDSWILDEDGSKKVKALARKHGVLYFTRKGLNKYNQPDAPFKKKTKAGNVNAWIDRVKRRKYEFFVQLDIDHIPNPNYLNKTLGYFRDSKVAWVQAPSVYGNHQHWTSLGSSEQELVLQGPLQMGFYGHSNTPFILGSHTTYRMSAVKEMGGYQPTRAEDHLDTITLANHGYEGVFLPEIIAVGDGPETLETYLKQQFAWAYSMTQVLISHTPKLLGKLSVKEKFVFLFAQTWYPLWSAAYFVMFMAPIMSLLLNQNIATMSARDFLVHFIPTFLGGFMVWWAARPLMQPKGVGLSWRGMLLHVVRWPVIIKAIWSALFRITKPYMITPKGKSLGEVPNMQTYRPFLALGFLSILSIFYSAVVYQNPNVFSQILFASVNAIFMFTICAVELRTRLGYASKRMRKPEYWIRPITATLAGFFLLATTVASAPVIIAQSESYDLTTLTAQAQPNTDYDNMTEPELIEEIRRMPAPNISQRPKVGFYDPAKLLTENQQVLQHEFADWDDSRFLAKRVLEIRRANNIPVVTIEPRVTGVEGVNVLSGITNGEYDSQLKNIKAVLTASNSRTYIRFAHEMELANLYPWGNQSPSEYIAAYKYVVDYMEEDTDTRNLIWIWSPAGNRGAEAYYPGDNYVDIIGVTVLYDTYWQNDIYIPFPDLAGQRLWLKQFGKPLWIAEFGVGTDDKELQKRLLTDSLYQYDDLGFDALLILNIKDSNIEGPDYTIHDKNFSLKITQN